MTNSNDTIGNWTRELSAYRAVPQPTAPNPAPIIYRNSLVIIYDDVQIGPGSQSAFIQREKNASSCTSIPPHAFKAFSSLWFMSLLPVPYYYQGNKKVKWSRYRPGVAQRVGRGIALPFNDRGTRRGEWSAARPGRTLPPGKTRYPFYRRLDGPQGRCGRAEILVPAGIRSRTVQPVVSLYRLSYRAHTIQIISGENLMDKLVA